MTTTINHKIRLELDIGVMEYCFLDMIYQSKKKSFTFKDFYNKIGFSEDYVIASFHALKRSNLIIFDGNTAKTTNEWNKYFEKKKKFTPPQLEDVINYFKENGYKEEAGRKAFRYYATADWEDATGKKIKNWKQKMIGVWFKDENKETKKQNLGESTSNPQKPIDVC